MNAGNIEDPPMAEVLMIRLNEWHRRGTRWVHIDSVFAMSLCTLIILKKYKGELEGVARSTQQLVLKSNTPKANTRICTTSHS